MSSDRSYRGVTLRPHYRNRSQNGWWLLPQGPLAEHPDRAWIRTLGAARDEIDGHRYRIGPCAFRDETGRWLGVVPTSVSDPVAGGG